VFNTLIPQLLMVSTVNHLEDGPN